MIPLSLLLFVKFQLGTSVFVALLNQININRIISCIFKPDHQIFSDLLNYLKTLNWVSCFCFVFAFDYANY